MVALGASGPDWRDRVRPYFGLCLGMPNYRRNLLRFGFTEGDLDAVSDPLVDALAVPDDAGAIRARVDAHRAAGADHVQVQMVPPPPAGTVLDRVSGGFADLTP